MLINFIAFTSTKSYFTLAINGEVAEWLKALAWKACLLNGNVGSNPTLSAL